MSYTPAEKYTCQLCNFEFETISYQDCKCPNCGQEYVCDENIIISLSETQRRLLQSYNSNLSGMPVIFAETVDNVKSCFDSIDVATEFNPSTGILTAYSPTDGITHFRIWIKLRHTK